MNNIQLVLEFDKIFIIQNPFDAYLALKALNREYKKSPFYKQTKMKLEQAYKLYELNKAKQLVQFVGRFQDAEYVGNLITDYLNNIDSNSINNFLTKITEIFNIENIDELKGELQKVINTIPR